MQSLTLAETEALLPLVESARRTSVSLATLDSAQAKLVAHRRRLIEQTRHVSLFPGRAPTLIPGQQELREEG